MLKLLRRWLFTSESNDLILWVRLENVSGGNHIKKSNFPPKWPNIRLSKEKPDVLLETGNQQITHKDAKGFPTNVNILSVEIWQADL